MTFANDIVIGIAIYVVSVKCLAVTIVTVQIATDNRDVIF